METERAFRSCAANWSLRVSNRSATFTAAMSMRPPGRKAFQGKISCLSLCLFLQNPRHNSSAIPAIKLIKRNQLQINEAQKVVMTLMLTHTCTHMHAQPHAQTRTPAPIELMTLMPCLRADAIKSSLGATLSTAARKSHTWFTILAPYHPANQPNKHQKLNTEPRT